MYKNAEIAAYITAMINHNDRILMGQKSPTMLTPTYKRYAEELNDLLDFATNRKVAESKSTLELNKELVENVRAYQNDLAEKESTIETLSMNLGGLGYIEQENMMLEADNLKLNNQLALQETKRKELFKECWEAEIENGKYIMEIQDLKTDNQMWQAMCIELREKLEKATKCQWWID